LNQSGLPLEPNISFWPTVNLSLTPLLYPGWIHPRTHEGTGPHTVQTPWLRDHN